MSRNPSTPLRIMFKDKPYLVNASPLQGYPEPANKPSAFTYAEQMSLYSLIKPYRNPAQMPHIREDLITYYDRVTYQPTRKLMGTLQGMRGDAKQSLVFYVTKHTEPGQPSHYEGAILGVHRNECLAFETPNFAKVLSILSSHLRDGQLQGAKTFPDDHVRPAPQG